MKIDRTKPFLSKIKSRKLINHGPSLSETYEVILDLKGADIDFKPGDSVGVFVENDPYLVNRILKASQVAKEHKIIDPRSKNEMTFHDFLIKKVNLSRINSFFLKIGEKTKFLLDDKDAISAYLSSHDLIDFFEENAHLQFSLEELLPHFAPLLPRFYSIASSLSAHPHEVHLLVALAHHLHNEEKRFGVASHFLCHLAHEHETVVPLYVQPSHDFHLPDNDADIIMIGPGTGVAPFKAFMEERRCRKAKGSNWLFFGEKQQKYDFFYEDFWSDLVAKNELKLDVAFSRDQENKYYVQHAIYEKRQEIWTWIRKGCYIFICGSAQPMAKDVEATLARICQEMEGFSEEDSKSYIKKMKKDKRLLLDVY
ncbi:MAG: sulfite reductase [Rhabdochlamydiaceae bacterium]